MKAKLIQVLLALSSVAITKAQNVAVNITGNSAAATNMFEITQPSTDINSVGLYTIHSGAVIGTGYALQAIKTGASTSNIAGYFSATGGTNNYAIIVPSASGFSGFGTTTPGYQIDAQNNSASGYVGSFLNLNVNGTGLIGRGNNQAAQTGTNGAGVSGIGTDIGIFGVGTASASGAGIVGIGNNGATYYLTGSGSGGSFTGQKFGLITTRDATSNANGEGAGWFSGKSDGTFDVFVAYRSAGTNYKITGVGSVATLVKDNLGRDRVMVCPEAPEILFQDFGKGILTNGRAHITLDSLLSAHITVNEKHPLRVFIQLEGDCNGVFVTNKTQNGFDVIELKGGASNVSFTWFIAANRADEVNFQTGKIESLNADSRFPILEHPKSMRSKVKKTDLIFGR